MLVMKESEKITLHNMLEDLLLYAQLVSNAANRIGCAIQYNEPSDPYVLPQKELKISEFLEGFVGIGFVIDEKLNKIIEKFGDEFIYN
jgi:hypothetical protein